MSTGSASFFTGPVQCCQMPGKANSGPTSCPLSANQCQLRVCLHSDHNSSTPAPSSVAPRTTASRTRLQHLIVAHVRDTAPRLAAAGLRRTPRTWPRVRVRRPGPCERRAPYSREDRELRRKRDRAVIGDPEQPNNRVPVAGLRIEIAHAADVITAPLTRKGAGGDKLRRGKKSNSAGHEGTRFHPTRARALCGMPQSSRRQRVTLNSSKTCGPNVWISGTSAASLPPRWRANRGHYYYARSRYSALMLYDADF